MSVLPPYTRIVLFRARMRAYRHMRTCVLLFVLCSFLSTDTNTKQVEKNTFTIDVVENAIWQFSHAACFLEKQVVWFDR